MIGLHRTQAVGDVAHAAVRFGRRRCACFGVHRQCLHISGASSLGHIEHHVGGQPAACELHARIRRAGQIVGDERDHGTAPFLSAASAATPFDWYAAAWSVNRSAYWPFSCISCSCVPCSTSSPLWRT